ncbi:hypothetical protein EAF04_000290 [Stromatinia cepivora]|nr:hypothetical protein EAF04_000290 [Stromatinia cepivora]
MAMYDSGLEGTLASGFAGYGNIYFANDSFPGCEAAEIVGDVPADLKRVVAERFAIGPVVDRDFWNGKRASMATDRGPWENPQDYLTLMANREIAWISNFAVPKAPKDVFIASRAQNSPSSHISLYKMFLKNYESLEEGDEKARMRKQVEKSIILYTYETETDKKQSIAQRDSPHTSWPNKERNGTFC